MDHRNLLVEIHATAPLHTALVRLHRPAQRNALNREMMRELEQVLGQFDADPTIACCILTGDERAFAAGADVRQMADYQAAEAYADNLIGRDWAFLQGLRKPLLAAVDGVAFGGGCELVLCCDIVIAADSARFALPEVKLGVIPGAGGTQRLPRAIGKAKAMDMVLTARTFDALEAERAGLVSRVVPARRLLAEALAVGEAIGQLSLPSLMAAKEAVNRAFEVPLAEGMRHEQRLFHLLFATDDQKEGMHAFLEKRSPVFRHR